MTLDLALSRLHPVGDQSPVVDRHLPAGVKLDSFTGPVHVEWDAGAAMTPLGQLPFFVDFLKTTGLFDAFVADCPLRYVSPNAPKKRDLLGTTMLSMLSGHKRYAHIAGLRGDGVLPELLGMAKIVSEDAVRRGLKAIDEEEGAVWLRRHLDYCTAPLLSESWILDIDTTVKPLYGHQEGAVVGYNPKKPGRPSHCYHTHSMGARGWCSMSMCALGMSTRPNIAHPACGRCSIASRAINGLCCCAVTRALAMSRSCARRNSAAWPICLS
jgi:hypothetical protein